MRDQVAIESLEFLKQKYSFPPDKDIPAISTVLIAGIVYLVMRTKVSNTFLGIDFSSSAGWQRIERAITSLVQTIVENDG
ncbi:MAG: hypothetical protein V7K18_19110 [Nostoc sp.]|uniref:hypothetical protein n=1 Tax=Nostoc sp. TaxID=1180 RepID=UPI002FF4C9A9